MRLVPYPRWRGLQPRQWWGRRCFMKLKTTPSWKMRTAWRRRPTTRCQRHGSHGLTLSNRSFPRDLVNRWRCWGTWPRRLRARNTLRAKYPKHSPPKAEHHSQQFEPVGATCEGEDYRKRTTYDYNRLVLLGCPESHHPSPHTKSSNLTSPGGYGEVCHTTTMSTFSKWDDMCILSATTHRSHAMPRGIRAGSYA